MGYKVLKGGNNRHTGGLKFSTKKEEQVDVPIVKAPSFMSCDLRDKPWEARAARVKELRASLKNIENDTSGKARARRGALEYSLSIFCK